MMGYGNVSVTQTFTKILDANSKRNSFVIFNNDSSLTVYIGQDNSVTSSNGLPLISMSSFQQDSGTKDMWLGDIYGVLSSGTSADIRYWETIR